MKAPFLLGRLVFGGFFLYSGINHFKHYQQLVQYSKAKKVPAPEAAVLGSGALLALGGSSILLGFRPKLGSLAILGFLATASPSIHDFWNDQDAGQKQNNMAHFSKNIALLGAALALFGVEEPWPASISRDKKHDSEHDVEVEAEERPLRLSQRRAEHRRAA